MTATHAHNPSSAATNGPATDPHSDPHSDLEIRAADQGGFFAVQVACGTLNDHTATSFNKLMEGVVNRSSGNIAIALGGVGSITSAGLSALVGVARACNEQGGRCVLCDVPDDIARIIRTTRLDKIAPIAGSIDDARKVLGPNRKRGPLARLLGAA